MLNPIQISQVLISSFRNSCKREGGTLEKQENPMLNPIQISQVLVSSFRNSGVSEINASGKGGPFKNQKIPC